MATERIEILTILNELKTPVTLNELIGKAGMSRVEALGLLNGLLRDGYVNEKDKKYTIGTKGQIALKEFNPVDHGKEFQFYIGIDQYAGVSAKSIEEFLDLLKTIDARALEFHIARGDFEAWVRDVFGDHELAQEFADLKEAGIKEEVLRTRISEIVDRRYKGFSKLLA